ncbi:unnamed protein product, partial [Pylaiella littoralis]
AEWTYRTTGPAGEEPYGPSDWYLGYPDCASDSQSPINLAASLIKVAEVRHSDSDDDSGIEFNESFCESTDLTFKADFAVWQVNFDACPNQPYLKWHGEVYNLLQVHINSPSEHLFGGAERDAEIQMMHLKEGTADELLVVGILLDASEYGVSFAVQNSFEVLARGDTTTTGMFTIPPYEILPQSPSYTHYMGSLTTPPCSEGVQWIVMNEAIRIGKRQLMQFRQAVEDFPGSKASEEGNTNRPAQALNGRDLTYVP